MKVNTLVEEFKQLERIKNFGIYFIENQYKTFFISYNELFNKATKLLYSLQKIDIKAGNEIVFQINDNYQFILLFWSCIIGGIIPVPLSLAENLDNKKKIINALKSLKFPFLIVNKNNLPETKSFLIAENKNLFNCIEERIIIIEDLSLSEGKGEIHNPEPEDIAFIQFTSGSTSECKGIQLTHQNIITNVYDILIIGLRTPIESDNRYLSWLPLTHDMGIVGFHIAPLVGHLNQYLIPSNIFIRNPNIWFEKLSEYNITITTSPNFGYRFMLNNCSLKPDSNINLSLLKFMGNGAEPISYRLCKEFEAKFSIFGLKKNVICPCYGMAEATLAICISNQDEEIKKYSLNRKILNIGDKIVESINNNSVDFVSVGIPFDSIKVRITDNEDNEFCNLIVGNIQIKGKNVTNGYYNNSRLTQDAFTKDGWFKTGDIGFRDEERLVIVGRSKDIIFINGQNYYSHDLEAFAEEMDEIDTGSVVISCPVEPVNERNEILCFIKFRKSLNEFILLSDKLNRYFFKNLGFTFNRIIPIKIIPKTTSGKLQRFKLVKKYQENEFKDTIELLIKTKNIKI